MHKLLLRAHTLLTDISSQIRLLSLIRSLSQLQSLFLPPHTFWLYFFLLKHTYSQVKIIKIHSDFFFIYPHAWWWCGIVCGKFHKNFMLSWCGYFTNKQFFKIFYLNSPTLEFISFLVFQIFVFPRKSCFFSLVMTFYILLEFSSISQYFPWI